MGGYLNRTVGSVLGLLATLAPFSTAHAVCEGKSVQFSDDFSHPSAAWGPVSKDVFQDGKYIMIIPANGTMADWPDNVLFSGDYSVCAKIKLPVDPTGAAGSGVIFWVDPAKNAKGGRNLYMAMISPDRFYWVVKQSDGEKSNVIEPVQSDLIKTGPDAVNEIVVLINGERASLTINDKNVGDFKGTPPNQSYAGILGGAPIERKYQVEFLDFRIMKP